MGIHFAHTQSEELRSLNRVSRQQTGAAAMRLDDFFFSMLLCGMQKEGCLCICQRHLNKRWSRRHTLPHPKSCFVMQIDGVAGVIGAGARC